MQNRPRDSKPAHLRGRLVELFPSPSNAQRSIRAFPETSRYLMTLGLYWQGASNAGWPLGTGLIGRGCVPVFRPYQGCGGLPRSFEIVHPRYTKSMLQMLIFIMAVGSALLSASNCVGQGSLVEESSEVSREEWLAQVRASRERADLMRRERRNFPPYAPTAQEIAEEASRRALEDDSLMPGDIVSTNQGLFQFRGAPGGKRTRDDFLRIR